jgi:hypothetical protein
MNSLKRRRCINNNGQTLSTTPNSPALDNPFHSLLSCKLSLARIASTLARDAIAGFSGRY